MAESDADAWDAVRTGDPEGLTAIYHRHVDAVFGFAFRRTASRPAAEDVVQATFTTVWRQARQGRLAALTLATARPLLLRMADNECRNLHRSRRRGLALQERLHLRDIRPDVADTASDRVDDELRMSVVRRALDQLPKGQREAIELVVWAELSTSEAAFTLGVAEGTVKSRVSRGKQRLQQLVTDDGEGDR